MILADTSVWIDHLRGRSTRLVEQLERREVMIHPFVIGELMLSGAYRRPDAMAELRQLPSAPLPAPREAEALIERGSLDGRGIGYVDAVLLAAVRLSPGTLLWTLDRKLHRIAAAMLIAFDG
jgi:hypothetical protein